jgi:hypothetical protein
LARVGSTPKERTDRTTGVEEIKDLMLEGKWRPGKSHRELAKKYGVQTGTIRSWTAEAGRYLRIVFGDEDTVREQLLAHIDQYLELCGHDERAIYDLATKEWATYEITNLGALFKGIELKCKIHGLLARPIDEDRANRQDVPLDEVVRLLEAQGITCVKDGKAFDPRVEMQRAEESDESDEEK